MPISQNFPQFIVIHTVKGFGVVNKAEVDVFLESLAFAKIQRMFNIISDQISADIRALVELLPDEQREVVMLRYYSDLSFKEIAEQTGVSINTALGRMRYALINMRKMIQEKKISLC